MGRRGGGGWALAPRPGRGGGPPTPLRPSPGDEFELEPGDQELDEEDERGLEDELDEDDEEEPLP
jgi:hypothetical protein